MGIVMTLLRRGPLSVAGTQDAALSLSEGLRRDDQTTLVRRPQRYLSMTQRKPWLGGPFSAQGSLCQEGQKEQGPRLELKPGCFL